MAEGDPIVPLDPRRDGLPPDPVLPAATVSLLTLAALLALALVGAFLP